MIERGTKGSIVNTASAAGVVAVPMHGEYVGAKHAVVGLTRIAAVDYGQQGIRVNAVLPGAIRTPMLMSVIENERSEEHTSELQSLMRISYAVFCLKKKKQPTPH